ncbi:putative lumenal polypeptide [Micractinium conductrix]|uniref:Lumenal polypeptide n=1 Tax=Micractinium conductrix TaxID=554055 RepID=A0A2P6V123_9CHLO|nr:putative lumenal polypeptide [Micractinium conductrix]|eukprot:PSC67788.1 putative lumenal polypeptide [Micractinium conductrix]
MQAALTQTKVVVAAPKAVARRPAQRVACSAVPQKEESQSRRAALGLFGAAVLSLTAAAAEATVTSAKNSSTATMEGYNMEGTKKQGISAKRRKNLLKKLRSNAEKAAAGQ